MVTKPLARGGERVLLDVETQSPPEAVSTHTFIVKGRAPAASVWHIVPWETFAELRVVTYDQLIRPDVSFVRFLRRREREERDAYEAIPPRVRRHDRA